MLCHVSLAIVLKGPNYLMEFDLQPIKGQLQGNEIDPITGVILCYNDNGNERYDK